jgi:hypothetical protein
MNWKDIKKGYMDNSKCRNYSDHHQAFVTIHR